MEARLKLHNDEYLPSGSVIHWGERDPNNVSRAAVTCGRCRQKRVVTIQRGMNKTRWTGLCASCVGLQNQNEELSSGSIIHWGERDPNNLARVMVTCSLCKQRRFAKPKRRKLHSWLGICPQCIGKHLQKSQDEVLPSGSVIHWSERNSDDPRGAPVTCGICGEKRLTTVQRTPRWTGICRSCAGRRRDNETLKSGSIIHWAERDLENKSRVLITCGKCEEKRFCAHGTISTRNFTGLCSTCVPYSTRRGKVKPRSDEKLLSGSIIHWAERDPNNRARVMVTCGLCAHKRLTIPRHGKSKNKWTGFCGDHQRLLGLTDLAQRFKQSPLNSDGEDRRARGRKLGTLGFEREEFVTKVKESILVQWSERRSMRSITAKAVAAMLHLGGPDTGADVLRKRLRKSQVTTEWPEFVESVIAARQP